MSEIVLHPTHGGSPLCSLALKDVDLEPPFSSHLALAATSCREEICAKLALYDAIGYCRHASVSSIGCHALHFTR